MRIAKRALAPLLVIVILASVSYRENERHPFDFWSMNEDYANLCLAHGLNIDFWLSNPSFLNGRKLTDLNTLHPGLLLQASSWAGYRLSCIGKASDARTRCEDTLRNPSAFWLAIRCIAVFIGLACSALYAKAAWRYGFSYSLAVGLFYFGYDPAWDYSTRLLGNETFALPLGFAAAWAASRSLFSSDNHFSIKWWAAWGAICALCWLNKLNYIAWTVAALPAGAAYYVLRRPSVREMGLRIFVFAVSFIGVAFSLTTLWLGKGALGHIVRLHFAVLTHSGVYGAGSKQVVSFDAIQNALHSLAASWHFLVLAAAVCLLAVWVLFSLARNGKAAANNTALIIYLLCAAGLFWAATLKHYGPHYLVAGVPAVSFLMLAIGGHIGSKMRLLMSVAVALVLIHSYRRHAVIAELRYLRVAETKASLRKIEDLPGMPGDGTLWSYRLPDRRFGLDYTQDLSGVAEVATIIDEKFPSKCLVYYPWAGIVRPKSELVPFEMENWRYAIFDRDNYDYFVVSHQSKDREFFEKHCKRIIVDPTIFVFERIGR